MRAIRRIGPSRSRRRHIPFAPARASTRPARAQHAPSTRPTMSPAVLLHTPRSGARFPLCVCVFVRARHVSGRGGLTDRRSTHADRQAPAARPPPASRQAHAHGTLHPLQCCSRGCNAARTYCGSVQPRLQPGLMGCRGFSAAVPGPALVLCTPPLPSGVSKILHTKTSNFKNFAKLQTNFTYGVSFNFAKPQKLQKYFKRIQVIYKFQQNFKQNSFCDVLLFYSS